MARAHRAPRIGILGGGQLGMMLAAASDSLPGSCVVMSHDHRAPAAKYAPIAIGDVLDPEQVNRFGSSCDVVTIEVEAVSARGLALLAESGVDVFPQADLVERIQDKGRQKSWLWDAAFPTAPFRLFTHADEVREAVADGHLTLPFVQKTRTAGYDGRGVKVVRDESDLGQLLVGPCVVEDCVEIRSEISVVVARSVNGDVAVYEPVEMCFRGDDNILDYLVCPARVDAALTDALKNLARDVAVTLGIVGVLAVEMFVGHDGRIWVNELAPRPHNSGHHTVELCETSQYEQHLRAITGHTLGSVTMRSGGVMVNLLGKPGHRGAPLYRGLRAARDMRDTYVHIYGKHETWPLRKMGHVTIADDDVESAIHKAGVVRSLLEVHAKAEP